MKTLFNDKIVVVKNAYGKLEFHGDINWVDYVQELLEDINDFQNFGSNTSFRETNKIIDKYFIGEDAKESVRGYFIRNGCQNDIDVFNMSKDYNFMKGFCGILGNYILC